MGSAVDVDNCGTDRGYSQHLRAGESSCKACRDAHAAYQRRYRRTPGADGRERDQQNARRRAARRLINAHPFEFQRLVEEEMEAGRG